MKRSCLSKICGNNCCFKAINRELVKLKRAFDELNKCFDCSCQKKCKKKC